MISAAAFGTSISKVNYHDAEIAPSVVSLVLIRQIFSARTGPFFGKNFQDREENGVAFLLY
jgi:hypothetical protein